jgi:quercetin dioxygenase-like cupin family protein
VLQLQPLAIFGMQLSILKPYTGTGVLRWYNESLVNFLLTPEQSDGQLAILEFTIRRGSELPAHFHEHDDETFMVEEGEITFQVGDKLIEARPGTVVFAPRCLVHQYQIKTPAARFRVVITPGRFANFFWDQSIPAPQAELPPASPATALKIREAMAEAEKYGVMFA